MVLILFLILSCWLGVNAAALPHLNIMTIVDDETTDESQVAVERVFQSWNSNTGFTSDLEIFNIVTGDYFSAIDAGCSRQGNIWRIFIDTTSESGMSMSCLAKDVHPFLRLSIAPPHGTCGDNQENNNIFRLPISSEILGNILTAVLGDQRPESAILCDDECIGCFNGLPEIAVRRTDVVAIDVKNDEARLNQDMLKLSQMSEVTDFIFIGTNITVTLVIKLAKQHDLLLDNHRWVIFLLDGQIPVGHSLYTNGNIILITDVELSSSSAPQNTRLQFLSASFEETLHMVSETWSSIESTPTLMEPLMSVNACCIVAEDCPNNTRLFRMFAEHARQVRGPPKKFYIFSGETSTALKKVATWNGTSLNMASNSRNALFPGFKLMTRLRVVTSPEPPFVFRKDTDSGPTYSGYAIDVLDIISQRMNFQYDIKEPEFGTYGQLDDNGQWDGCMREIVTGAADVIIAALTVTADRENVVDFTTPYYDFAGIQIMMKRQVREANLFMFLTVFDSSVWYCLIAVMFITAFLLVVFDKLSPNTEVDVNLCSYSLIKERLWFVHGSITQAGGGDTPQCLPSRIIVAGFWFFSLIIMSTFTANLAAFLTVSRLTVNIQNLENLADQVAVKYSVVEGSPVMTYFKRMAEIENKFYIRWKDISFEESTHIAVWDYPLGDKYARMWRSVQEAGFVANTQEGIERVLAGQFAFIHESPIIEYETTRNCELIAVGEQFSSKPYAFALRHNSYYTEEMSNIILALQQELVLDNLKKKWWEREKVSCTSNTENAGLDLVTLRGVFIVMAVGLGGGILVVLIERCWYKYTISRLKNNTPKSDSNRNSLKGVPFNVHLVTTGDDAPSSNGHGHLGVRESHPNLIKSYSNDAFKNTEEIDAEMHKTHNPFAM